MFPPPSCGHPQPIESPPANVELLVEWAGHVKSGEVGLEGLSSTDVSNVRAYLSRVRDSGGISSVGGCGDGDAGDGSRWDGIGSYDTSDEVSVGCGDITVLPVTIGVFHVSGSCAAYAHDGDVRIPAFSTSSEETARLSIMRTAATACSPTLLTVASAPSYKLKVCDSDGGFSSVAWPVDRRLLDPESSRRLVIVYKASKKRHGIREARSGDEGGGACGVIGGVPGRGDEPEDDGGGPTSTKHQRVCHGSALSAEATGSKVSSGLRGLLMLSSALGSTPNAEEVILRKHGLVEDVLYPANIMDVFCALETANPTAVLVSARHNGERVGSWVVWRRTAHNA